MSALSRAARERRVKPARKRSIAILGKREQKIMPLCLAAREHNELPLQLGIITWTRINEYACLWWLAGPCRNNNDAFAHCWSSIGSEFAAISSRCRCRRVCLLACDLLTERRIQTAGPLFDQQLISRPVSQEY